MAASSTCLVPTLYNRILSRFPSNLSFCFAYGSGVKNQLKNTTRSNMIDLIYCVDEPSKWHKENIIKNSSDYSSLKYFGHNIITNIQELYAAKVYFNTLVPFEDITIKYGIISTKDLVTDLLEWSDLYLAGRLHKPVDIIKHPSSSEIQTAIQLNLQSVVHATLLTLPENFTEYDFYKRIASMSYSGDFRMIFGENKNKVENIVRPQILEFRDLYLSLIKKLHDYVYFPIADIKEANDPLGLKCCLQDVSPLARLHHLNQLPRWPQKALTRFWNRGKLRQDTEDILRAIAYDPDCSIIVEDCINGIVWNSSIKQSLKGVLTAGVFKSIKYSSKKIMKMLK